MRFTTSELRRDTILWTNQTIWTELTNWTLIPAYEPTHIDRAASTIPTRMPVDRSVVRGVFVTQNVQG